MEPSKRLLRPYFETGNDKFKDGGCQYRMNLYLSFCTKQQRNSNANPMFSESENSVALLVMLYLETGSEKFKMAAPNRKYLYLSFCTR
jgi:hypothetical protein